MSSLATLMKVPSPSSTPFSSSKLSLAKAEIGDLTDATLDTAHRAWRRYWPLIGLKFDSKLLGEYLLMIAALMTCQVGDGRESRFLNPILKLDLNHVHNSMK